VAWLGATLRAHPELALFVTLALGHAAARLRLGPLELNAIMGVLLAGVAVGQFRIDVPGALQWAFFVLFLFSVGYKTGPQFFRGIGRDALPQVGLALVLCATSLATTYAVARVLGFDAGMAAGLLAGAMNASAAIGSASDAVARLAADDATREALSGGVTVAFAVTYLVGLITCITTLAYVAPRLMRVDLAEQCRKLESEIGSDQAEPGVFSAYQRFVARAYRVPRAVAGKTVADLERSFAPARVFVERVRSAIGLSDASAQTVLVEGDVLALAGSREALVEARNPLRDHEVDDPELLDIPATTVDVVLTRRDLAQRTLAELVAAVDAEAGSRGVFLRSITRAGEPLPYGPRLTLERGDVLRLVGAKADVERIASYVGFADWPSQATDVVALAVAIALGGLIGVPVLRVAGLDLGLSIPVGVLLGGLVVGWMRSVRPTFGRVPDAAAWVFESLGLSAFLACVGIGAGPGFVRGLETSGLALIVAGVVACAVPNIVTVVVGRYLLRMHPGVLLGICAGAGTSPAALAAVQDVAKSRVPTLGYGVSYAVGNVLLALWGSVIVALMAP
jgi:putative transport protein